MGSSPLLSFLVLTSLVLLFVTPSHSSEYDVVQEPAPPVTSRKISRNSEKVTMSLYYESLCPYCSSFIAGPLAQVLETDLMTILNLRLVPWGNAILDSNNTIECQHGEDECYLNIIHACAINLWPDLVKPALSDKCLTMAFNFPGMVLAQGTPQVDSCSS